MDEQRKYAVLFAAAILAARKLNESGSAEPEKVNSQQNIGASPALRGSAPFRPPSLTPN